MNRAEHLQWCKDRANQEFEVRGPQAGFMSMTSDLRKHKELEDHIGLRLGMAVMMNGFSRSEVKEWINGFN